MVDSACKKILILNQSKRMIKRIIILVYLTTLNYRFSTPISFTSRSRPQLLRSRRDTERQAPSAEDTAKDDRSAAQADMELYYRVYLILSLMDQAKQDYKDECKDAMIFYSFFSSSSTISFTFLLFCSLFSFL